MAAQILLESTHPREPGLWRADPYLERYTVPPCGSVTFELFAGDAITVTDPEGAQPGELIAFSTDGHPAPGGLCGTRPKAATGFQKILASNEPSAQQVAAGLKRRNINAADAKAIALFGSDSDAGSTHLYTARENLLCIVCAPGDAMPVDEQIPPTELTVHVARARVVNSLNRYCRTLWPTRDWNFGSTSALQLSLRCMRANTSRSSMLQAGSVQIFLLFQRLVLIREKSGILI